MKKESNNSNTVSKFMMGDFVIVFGKIMQISTSQPPTWNGSTYMYSFEDSDMRCGEMYLKPTAKTNNPQPKESTHITWWKGLNEEEQTKLCQKHFQGIPVESLMERSIKVMFHYENPSTTEKELSTIALEWWNGLNEVAKWDAAYRHSNITNIFFHQKLEKIDIEILYKAEHTQPPTTNTVTGEVMKTHNLTMLAAMEFGYRECEKGNNLDMAFINFNKALQNK